MPNVGALFSKAADNRKFKPSTMLVLPECRIGVEAELENVRGKQVGGLWSTKTDGSLHEDGLEYVFSEPMFGEDIVQALDQLEAEFTDSNVTTGDDTSLHVHLDVRDMTPIQLNRLLMFYFMFEDVLFNYCAPDREDNIFCTSLHKAQYAINTYAEISYSILHEEYDKLTQLIGQLERYSAINVAAIARFGSVEFRGHRGEWRKEPILRWINILQSLKKSAMNDTYAGDKPYVRIKQIGTHAFLEEVFGDYATYLMNENIHEQVFKGLQLVRRIANYKNKLFSLFDIGAERGNELFDNLKKEKFKLKLPSQRSLELTDEEYELFEQIAPHVADNMSFTDVADYVKDYGDLLHAITLLDDDEEKSQAMRILYYDGYTEAMDYVMDHLEPSASGEEFTVDELSEVTL